MRRGLLREIHTHTRQKHGCSISVEGNEFLESQSSGAEGK